MAPPGAPLVTHNTWHAEGTTIYQLRFALIVVVGVARLCDKQRVQIGADIAESRTLVWLHLPTAGKIPNLMGPGYHSKLPRNSPDVELAELSWLLILQARTWLCVMRVTFWRMMFRLSPRPWMKSKLSVGSFLLAHHCRITWLSVSTRRFESSVSFCTR